MYPAQTYSNVNLDMLVVVLLALFAWRLHLPKTQKLAVIGISLLGLMQALRLILVE